MPYNDIITNRDIVVVGQQPWDTPIGSNCKDVAVEFSKNNRVLYVNSALDRISMIRHKDDPKIKRRVAVIRGKESGLVPLGPNFWNLFPSHLVESINWIKSRKVFDLLNKRNNRLFAQSILAAMKELGFKDIILFNDNEIFRAFYLKEFLKPDVSMYYSRDYVLGTDYWRYHGVPLEPKLIAKSDFCVANSDFFADNCRKYNPNSYNIGQGCDLELFSNDRKWPEPEDMKGIKKPIIGYVGALLKLRLDIDLLVYIATQRPDWSLVLVGPEDEAFKHSQLHHLENVHFPGHKEPEILPQYINFFDVCLNPQSLNEITNGNYPRKIDEYLAMSKPVVATRTDAMRVFEDYIYLAVTKEDYVNLIKKALEENTREVQVSRRHFAESHSWENHVKEIYKRVNQVLDKKKRISA